MSDIDFEDRRRPTFLFSQEILALPSKRCVEIFSRSLAPCRVGPCSIIRVRGAVGPCSIILGRGAGGPCSIIGAREKPCSSIGGRGPRSVLAVCGRLVRVGASGRGGGAL